jgi:Icc-related predicted phosphoesterase
MRIVCISDTHGWHRDLAVPDGDLLVHAGDITRKGELDTVADFERWLGELPHRHKVVICGNHDFAFQEQPPAARGLITNAVYLEDSAVTIGGLTVYGSPWQPWFGGWGFNLERGPALAAVWAKIPDHTDILITHGPPAGILDRTNRGELVGCRDLFDRVMEVRPRLHVFGHIHEAAGRLDAEGITFVNASVYRDVGGPVVVEWDA